MILCTYIPRSSRPNERDAQVERCENEQSWEIKSSMFTFDIYVQQEIEGEAESSSSPTASMQSSSQLYPPSPLLSAFEFTKRKRWADLLITELTEAIILILSTQCQILYCSAAV